jgi:hypothetical protein
MNDSNFDKKLLKEPVKKQLGLMEKCQTCGK